MDEDDLQIDHRVSFKAGGDFFGEQEPEFIYYYHFP
jgi:hypothetical protein